MVRAGMCDELIDKLIAGKPIKVVRGHTETQTCIHKGHLAYRQRIHTCTGVCCA